MSETRRIEADLPAVYALPSPAGNAIGVRWDPAVIPEGLPGVFSGENRPELKHLEAGASSLSIHCCLLIVQQCLSRSIAPDRVSLRLIDALDRLILTQKTAKKPTQTTARKTGFQSYWASTKATGIGPCPFSRFTTANLLLVGRHG